MNRGMTLVELVLTIALAGIIGFPTGLLVFEHFRSAMDARDAVVATQLARYEMERLDGLNNFFAAPDLDVSCPSGSLVTACTQGYQGFAYDMLRRVDCIAGDCCQTGSSSQGMKRIRVTISKTNSPACSAQPLAELRTYRAKHVLFGS